MKSVETKPEGEARVGIKSLSLWTSLDFDFWARKGKSNSYSMNVIINF